MTIKLIHSTCLGAVDAVTRAAKDGWNLWMAVATSGVFMPATHRDLQPQRQP